MLTLFLSDCDEDETDCDVDSRVRVSSIMEIRGSQEVDPLLITNEESQSSSRMSIKNFTLNCLRNFQNSQFEDLLEQSESTCHNESDRPFFYISIKFRNQIQKTIIRLAPEGDLLILFFGDISPKLKKKI